jgi:hypothetical protein
VHPPSQVLGDVEFSFDERLPLHPQPRPPQQFPERLVSLRLIAFQRQYPLVNRIQEPGGLREEQGLQFRRVYAELDQGYYHKVRIEYYPPRGDAKESWDNLDIFGWLGYPMQIKVSFQCRDSILAAPMALDLVLFLDLAQRCPEMAKKGIQEWLSLYFKGPQVAAGLYPEHDVFIQLMKLRNTLRYLRGEELIMHLGLEYYD